MLNRFFKSESQSQKTDHYLKKIRRFVVREKKKALEQFLTSKNIGLDYEENGETVVSSFAKELKIKAIKFLVNECNVPLVDMLSSLARAGHIQYLDGKLQNQDMALCRKFIAEFELEEVTLGEVFDVIDNSQLGRDPEDLRFEVQSKSIEKYISIRDYVSIFMLLNLEENHKAKLLEYFISICVQMGNGKRGMSAVSSWIESGMDASYLRVALFSLIRTYIGIGNYPAAKAIIAMQDHTPELCEELRLMPVLESISDGDISAAQYFVVNGFPSYKNENVCDIILSYYISSLCSRDINNRIGLSFDIKAFFINFYIKNGINSFVREIISNEENGIKRRSLLTGAISLFVKEKSYFLAEQLIYSDEYKSDLNTTLCQYMKLLVKEKNIPQIKYILFLEKDNAELSKKLKILIITEAIDNGHDELATNFLLEEKCPELLRMLSWAAFKQPKYLTDTGEVLEILSKSAQDDAKRLIFQRTAIESFVIRGLVPQCYKILTLREVDEPEYYSLLQGAVAAFAFNGNYLEAKTLMENYNQLKPDGMHSLCMLYVVNYCKPGASLEELEAIIAIETDLAEKTELRKNAVLTFIKYREYVLAGELIDSITDPMTKEVLLREFAHSVAFFPGVKNISSIDVITSIAKIATIPLEIWKYAIQGFSKSLMLPEINSILVAQNGNQLLIDEASLFLANSLKPKQLGKLSTGELEAILKTISDLQDVKLREGVVNQLQTLGWMLMPTEKLLRIVNKVNEIREEFVWDFEEAYVAYQVWSLPVYLRQFLIYGSFEMPANVAISIGKYYLDIDLADMQTIYSDMQTIYFNHTSMWDDRKSYKALFDLSLLRPDSKLALTIKNNAANPSETRNQPSLKMN